MIHDKYFENIVRAMNGEQFDLVVDAAFSEETGLSPSDEELVAEYDRTNATTRRVDGSTVAYDVTRSGSNASSDGDDVNTVALIDSENVINISVGLTGITQTQDFDLNITGRVEFVRG